MEDKKLLIKNTGIYAIGDILPKVMGLIVFPILTYYLPPEEYGIINYVNTIGTFLSLISVLGLNTFFLAFYFEEKDDKGRRELYSTISYFIIAFSLVITLLLHLFGEDVFHKWGSNISFFPYISLGVIANFFDIITFLPICLYRVRENPLPLTIICVIKSFFILGVSVAVVLMDGMAHEILFARCMVSVLFSFVFLYSTKSYFALKFDLIKIRKALKFSIPLVPGSLAYYTFSMFDRVLIDKYLTLRDLGLYTTASTLAMVLNFVYNGAYKAFEPYFFQNYNKEGFEKKFSKVRDALLITVLTGALLISLFSKEFFHFFASDKYEMAYIYVPVIMIGVIASAMSLLYGTIVIAQKKPIMNTIITMIGCMISLSLNILFLKHFGAMVAAISFALSFLAILFLYIWIVHLKVSIVRSVMVSSFVILIIFIFNFFLPDCGVVYNIFIKTVVFLLTLFVVGKSLHFDYMMFRGVFNRGLFAK